MLVKIQKLTSELNKQRKTKSSERVSVKEEKETNEFIDELKLQLQHLSQSNSTLKTKVHFFKTLHEAETRKRTPYSHIPPRVESVKEIHVGCQTPIPKGWRGTHGTFQPNNS